MSLVNELKRVALRFSVSRRTTAAKQVRIFFHTQSAEGCLKEEIDILNIFC
jgi:hypothetical protein